jgi:putative ABC transport system permease protein
MRLPGADVVRMALQAPLRRPGRSALTALGLAIGVGTFIAMVSFGRGARSSVVSQFETLGSNLLRLKTYYGVTEGAPAPLTEGDVEALRRETTTLDAVVPFIHANVDVSSGTRSQRSVVSGTTPEFVRTREWRFIAGGGFDAGDMQRRAKVCVVGGSVADALFPHASGLGQSITIDGRLSCRVIGLLADRGATVTGGDPDNRIMLPLPTYNAHLGGDQPYSVIEIRPKSRELLAAATAEINQVIRRTHGIHPGGTIWFVDRSFSLQMNSIIS